MTGIYKITNTITNKVYIGLSSDILRRWWEHKSRAFEEKCNCYNSPLYRSIRKYGINKFHFEIICECSIEDLDKQEQYYINEYNSVTPNGYNIMPIVNKVYRKTTELKCSKCGKTISNNSDSGLCRECYSTSTRMVDRPSPEELKNLLMNSSFSAVGRKFGVSDNAIRKWCAGYGMSTKAKDYK